MSSFSSFENKNNKFNLIEQINKYKIENHIILKPFLTFNFPLNNLRKNGIEMLQSEKIEINKAIDLFKSDDFIEKICGAYLLCKTNNIPEKYHIQILDIIEKLDFMYDYYFLCCSKNNLSEILSKILNNKDIELKLINNLLDENKQYFLKEIIILSLGYSGEKYFNIIKDTLKKI